MAWDEGGTWTFVFRGSIPTAVAGASIGGRDAVPGRGVKAVRRADECCVRRIGRCGSMGRTTRRCSRQDRRADGANQVTLPIVFLLGPSGVGKSTLGAWVGDDLEFLHLEIDRWPEQDGIDYYGLRLAWNAFLSDGEATQLAGLIREFTSANQRRGAILSFPSRLTLEPRQIESAAAAGIATVVLFATKKECLASFLEREKASGRGFTSEHFDMNNASFERIAARALEPYRMKVRWAGGWRSPAELVGELRGRLIR